MNNCDSNRQTSRNISRKDALKHFNYWKNFWKRVTPKAVETMEKNRDELLLLLGKQL